MNSTNRMEKVKKDKDDSVAVAAHDAIMADGDLNKLLQLAHHCSSQHPGTQSAQEDQISSSANDIDKESVLAASSLHLPLIDSRSILQSTPAMNSKGGSPPSMDGKIPSGGRGYVDHSKSNNSNGNAHENGNGHKIDDEDHLHACGDTSTTTEKALLSLKHHAATAAAPTQTIEDQRRGNCRTSSKSSAQNKKQSNRKPRRTPNKKKARQKQMSGDSRNGDILNTALLRGVTMRPSGKWVSNTQAQAYNGPALLYLRWRTYFVF